MAVADIHMHAPTAFDSCVKYFVIRERSPWRAPVERVRTDAYGVGRHTDAGWAAQKGDWNFDGRVGFEDVNGMLAPSNSFEKLERIK